MTSIAQRIANIFFWLGMALTALTIGGVCNYVLEAWTYRNYFESGAVFLGIVAIAIISAVWIAIQYLLTGKIYIIAPRIVAALAIAAAIVGGIMGHNEGVVQRESALRVKQEAERLEQKRGAEEFERMMAALEACKDKLDVFQTTRKDGDYQMAKDLYEIYAKCVLKNGWKVQEWDKSIFDSGMQKNFPYRVK
jgi:hypothetical protein